MFELLYRDASQKYGPAVNQRRPYTMDLIYPLPELTPFIGRKKAPSMIPKQRAKREITKVVEESAIVEPTTPRKELVSSAATNRARSQNSFQVRKKTRAAQNYNS